MILNLKAYNSEKLEQLTKQSLKMVQILDYQAVEPLSTFNPETAFPIPQALFRVLLASIQINIPGTTSRNNRVELLTSVGVAGANFYQVFAENSTPNTQANIVGPVSFSGLVIKS